MNKVGGILEGLLPFVRLVALLFGVIAAYLAVFELMPALGQFLWRPRGTAQGHAMLGGALALIAMAGGK